MGGREALHILLPQDLCSQLLQKPQQLFLQASLKSPGLIPPASHRHSFDSPLHRPSNTDICFHVETVSRPY